MEIKQNKVKQTAPCLILGLGHTGCEVLEALPYLRQYPEIDLLGIDTDAQDIQKLRKQGIEGLLLGEEAVNGNGTSADSEQALFILRDAEEEISKYLENRRLLIAIAALGGGTGSAIEEVLSLADDLHVNVVLLAVMPFSFESQERKSTAQMLLSQMDVHCQAVIVIPNEKLLAHYRMSSAADAFSNASAYLARAAMGIATLFASQNLFNVSPGILATLGSVDGNPRCHFIQVSCESSEEVAGLASAIEQDLLFKELQPRGCVDRGIAFLRVSGKCREEEMDYVLKSTYSLFPGANMDAAACLDEVMPNYLSMTLLLHSVEQGIDDLGQMEMTEKAAPPALPVEPPKALPSSQPRRGRRRGAKMDSAQLTFSFPEYVFGIFSGDPPNLWNGVNVDIPTFSRMGEMIDKGS